MRRLLKHKLLLGMMALVAAGSAGGAYAATQSASNGRQALLNDVAKRLGVSPARLQRAVQGAMLDRLRAAVKAGEITQAEANRIKQRIERDGGLLVGPPGPAGGSWLHGPGVRDLAPPHGPLSAAAAYLGLSERQLITDVQGGKTLAQVAQARGKSVSGLEQALVSEIKSHLDRLVSAGMITASQEQQRLSRFSAMIDRLVTHGRLQMRRPPGSSGIGEGPPPGVPGPGPFAQPPPGA